MYLKKIYKFVIVKQLKQMNMENKERLKDKLNRIEKAIDWNRKQIYLCGGRNKFHERRILELNALASKIDEKIKNK